MTLIITVVELHKEYMVVVCVYVYVCAPVQASARRLPEVDMTTRHNNNDKKLIRRTSPERLLLDSIMALHDTETPAYSATPLCELPDELLLRVLYFLDIPELLSTSRVMTRRAHARPATAC